jgi:hypothetical protein
MDGRAVKFQRTRIPEPPYQCGFEPEAHSYGEYFNHISVCDNEDCRRRFVNHMLLQTYFARKYEGAKLSSNATPSAATTLPHGLDPLSQVEVETKVRPTFRADSPALRSPNGARRR